MNLEVNNKIGARFKLVARKVSTEEISRETDWFQNIVLDTGLARMSIGTWIDRCCVGTGNSTPVATQTQLDAFRASTNVNQSDASGIQITNLPYYMWVRRTWRFGEGVATGNISEVGLGWANANLWNRALVKDNSGNPTTITVLSDEYLDVIAEIRIYPQETFSGSFNLLNKAGVVVSSHTYVGRSFYQNPSNIYEKVGFANIFIYKEGLGSSPTSIPAATALNFGAPQFVEYPTPASIRAKRALVLNSGDGAHKTILVLQSGVLAPASGGSGYQVEFTPAITKTNQMELTYTVSMNWGRYTGA